MSTRMQRPNVFTTLFNAGFIDCLVPVIPAGAKIHPKSSIAPDKLGKIPGVWAAAGWSGRKEMFRVTTLEEAAAYDKHTPCVGISTGVAPAFDFDITDDDELVRVATDAVERKLGKGWLRKGRRAPGLLYAAADPGMSLGKRSITVANPRVTGDTPALHLLELFNAPNWHVNIAGPHNKGGTYVCTPPVEKWQRAAMPAVTAKALLEAWQAMVDAVTAAGYLVVNTATGHAAVARDDAGYPDQERLRAAPGELKMVLEKLTNTKGRARWVLAIHAIKAAGGDNEETRALLEQWCRTRTDGEPNVQEALRVFNGAGAAAGGKFRVGIQWLAEQAGDNVVLSAVRSRQAAIDFTDVPDAPMLLQSVMTLDEMLRDLVYIRAGDCVAYFDKPRTVAPYASALRAFAASTTLIVASETSRPRRVPTLDLWKNHPQRCTVETRIFAAGEPAAFGDPDSGEMVLNLWRPIPHIPPGDWEALCQPFLDHVEYLVPDKEQREWLFDWLAHIEQRPGELPHAVVLMVTSTQGTGRNWLMGLLARVWSGYVALGVDLPGLIDGGFNGVIAGKLLAGVDEIREGGVGRWNHSEKYKQLFTAQTRRIKPKYEREYTEVNALRWILLSNHYDALPLTDKDRRVCVIENPRKPRDPAYYQRIYGLLGDPVFARAVREWLRRRDLSGFNAGVRPPESAARQRVIEASQSDSLTELKDFVEQWPGDVIWFHDLVAHAGLGGRVQPRHLLSDIGAAAYPFRYGRRDRVWVLRNHDVWLNRTRYAVKEAADAATAAYLDNGATLLG